MADITIVGLGPGPRQERTLHAQHALDTAASLFVRGHGDDVDVSDLLAHPGAVDLRPLRDAVRFPQNPWQPAVSTVLDAAERGPVTLAIPGHPRVGEVLVDALLAAAPDHGLTTTVIDGISATDVLASALGVDPIRDGIQLVEGRMLSMIASDAPFVGGSVSATPRQPMLITHVYDAAILAGLAVMLARIFPPDHPVTRIEAAGLPGQQLSTHTIADLPHLDGGMMVALYVPAMATLSAGRDLRTLQHIVARLRRPDGCPWDRQQTNATLADSLVDEVYEAVDAISTGDDANLAEELGDLLLLIMMHAQIAEERGAFTMEDVAETVARKIVRRHPHVFGEMVATEADDVVNLWQRIKAQEKAAMPDRPEKAPDGQPWSMPALEAAQRVFAKQPLPTAAPPATTADGRLRALLQAISDCVVAGDDIQRTVRDALATHVQSQR